jgi:hypothetical protein
MVPARPEEEAFVLPHLEGAAFLLHVERAGANEDQLVGGDDAIRVASLSGRDEEAAVFSLYG